MNSAKSCANVINVNILRAAWAGDIIGRDAAIRAVRPLNSASPPPALAPPLLGGGLGRPGAACSVGFLGRCPSPAHLLKAPCQSPLHTTPPHHTTTPTTHAAAAPSPPRAAGSSKLLAARVRMQQKYLDRQAQRKVGGAGGAVVTTAGALARVVPRGTAWRACLPSFLVRYCFLCSFVLITRCAQNPAFYMSER